MNQCAILLKLKAMNKILLLLLLIPTLLYSQVNSTIESGGEFLQTQNNSCLSISNRSLIISKLKTNLRQLNNKIAISKSNNVSFDWPLKKDSNLKFNSYYAISNFVDQDTSQLGILEYNCNNRTYDGHKGTDIFLWPFSWMMVDSNYIEVVAADSGIIIGKDDGFDDDHCDFYSGFDWNAVYIQHFDGTITWYGHLKKNSLTTKQFGDSISKGEYLGIVASSGFSTGPHLHFEVYDSSFNLIDPFQGNCNNLNNLSYWTNQKPYRESTLNAILTHNSKPILGCPSYNESANISNVFHPYDSLFTAVYLHDQILGDDIYLAIQKPNNTVWQSWSHTFNATYSASYWYWEWTLPPNGPFGLWRFEALFNGALYYYEFNYTNTLNINETPSNKILSKITNILGQETTPKSNTPLFYLYDNGTVEKKIIVE